MKQWEVLSNAMKPDGKKSEMLAEELKMAYGIKIQAMEELVETLNNQKNYLPILDKVNTIDKNCELIGEMIELARAVEKGNQHGSGTS